MSDELTLLEMAQALNRMKQPLNTWECDLHDHILKLLLAGQPLSLRQTKKLKELHEKYLGEDAELEETIDDVDY